MVFNYYSFVVSSHVREKIYTGINGIYESSHNNKYINNFDIDSVGINFLFKNSSLNKLAFYSFMLLIEKLTLSKLKFLKMKSTVADFNIKKGLISGASYLLRGYEKDRFIYMLTNYSLKKMNLNIALYNTNHQNESLIDSDNISFGLRKFLFHGIFSSNDMDYDFFFPLIYKHINGLNLNFHFKYRHFFINKLVLSHNNINIF